MSSRGLRVWVLALSLVAVGMLGAGSQAGAAPTSAITTVTAVIAQNPTRLQNPAVLQFVNPQDGYALLPSGAPEGGGLLLRTADGGTRWRAVSLGPLSYVAMRFFSPTDGLLVGATPACGLVRPGCRLETLVTTDGGTRWRATAHFGQQAFTALLRGRLGAGLLETTTANCFGATCTPVQRLYRTTDDGASWTLAAEGPKLPAFTILAPDGSTLLGVANAAVYASSDGGSRWTRLGTFPHGATIFQAGSGTLDVVGRTDLYASVCNTAAVGNGGCQNYLFRSVDGGRLWAKLWTQYCTITSTVHMTSATVGVLILGGQTACQSRSALSNVVWSTHDGFRHLTLISRLSIAADSVSFTGGGTAYVMGPPLSCSANAALSCSPSVAVTRDDGTEWRIVTPTSIPDSVVAGASPNLWAAVGTTTNQGAVLIRHGQSAWRAVGTLPPAPLACPGPPLLQFPAAQALYAANLGSPALKLSQNGGKTFQSVWKAAPAEALLSLSFPNGRHPGDGYILVGSDGCTPAHAAPELMATTNFGHAWRRVGTLPSGTSSVGFTSLSRGLALVEHCRKSGGGCTTRVWVTVDGGRTWTPTTQHGGIFAGLTTMAPGMVTVATGPNLDIYRSGLPRLHVRLKGLVGTDGSVTAWVSHGWLSLVLGGEGTWTGPLATHALLEPLGMP